MIPALVVPERSTKSVAVKTHRSDMESRVQQAVELFESGYNCAQSVFAAYADLFGLRIASLREPIFCIKEAET